MEEKSERALNLFLNPFIRVTSRKMHWKDDGVLTKWNLIKLIQGNLKCWKKREGQLRKRFQNFFSKGHSNWSVAPAFVRFPESLLMFPKVHLIFPQDLFLVATRRTGWRFNFSSTFPLTVHPVWMEKIKFHLHRFFKNEFFSLWARSILGA